LLHWHLCRSICCTGICYLLQWHLLQWHLLNGHLLHRHLLLQLHHQKCLFCVLTAASKLLLLLLLLLLLQSRVEWVNLLLWLLRLPGLLLQNDHCAAASTSTQRLASQSLPAPPAEASQAAAQDEQGKHNAQGNGQGRCSLSSSRRRG